MTKYEQYSTTIVSEVPKTDMEIIIETLIKEAEISMGSEMDVLAVKMVTGMIIKEYRYLPVYVIAGAFKKGSMGKYGPGRLVPRTIYGWMVEMDQEHRQQSQNKADKIDTSKKWDGVHKYPVGKAINLKIDWLRSGRISESEYDRIPLKDVYERLAQGLECAPELWGIQSRNLKNKR